ncbi:hypothetical protein HYX06_03825 [Candidatus Woesearchaeota archaeon]|nr:hypothetical protein [Candidatus Woesearchaeota archaeon]
MNKKYYAIALLICMILLVSACKKSGAATGGAPRTPFLGGTAGLTVNFEEGSPPPEVTDTESFGFNAIVRLKNDGEHKIEKDNVKVNLVGFDPADFGQTFDEMKDAEPQDDLDAKKRDAEGNTVDGTTTYVAFPKSGGDFIPTKFPGNTPFTFRADVCYNYETLAVSKLCILKDMINIRDDSFCTPSGTGTSGRVIHSSSGPVQVQNFRQTVVGKDKISFSFDVVLTGSADVFWSKDERTPSGGFDLACPRAAKARREIENNVGVEITEIPVDPVFSNLKCGGLDSDSSGTVRMINNKRTIVCTADLVQDRLDLEKNVGVRLKYNILDNKEMEVLVKHLAEE